MQSDTELQRRLAADIRIQALRSMQSFGAGHVGGSMSMADILAVLYGGLLRFKSEDPNWEERDRLVVSKGHSGPALYAALALSGFFPTEWLQTLNQGGTRLPSHCDRNKTPGVDASTGSLGQGVSIACGFAQAFALQGKENLTYAIVGDGELQEGQVWECVQYAVHRGLGRFVMLVDNNKKQLDGTLEAVCKPMNLAEKFRSFGCEVFEVNGHNVKEMSALIEFIRATRSNSEKPVAVILHTVKGCGCSFAEAVEANHHLPVSQKDTDAAVAEIERRFAAGLLPGGERA